MSALAEMTKALGQFGTGLSQHARLIALVSSQESGLPESLMAEQLIGREAVNELFRFDVDALSTAASLDLANFLGEELTIKLLQPDGSHRAWHGLCTDSAFIGADGGVARYRLRLEPALSLLGLRRDSYIFQDKDARDIVTELLADYPQVRFEFDISQPLARRAVWTQYRETDLAFLVRVLAFEGLSWRFEHEQDADDEPAGAQQARHKLVIFDSKAKAPDTPGLADLRFHGVRASDSDDAIDAFRARRQVRANAVGISSWDPQQLLAPAAEHISSLDAGDLPPLPLYDGAGERRHADSAAADPHSLRMLQALELDNKQFAGAGAVRRMAAGHAFNLLQHEHYPDGANRFTTLWVEHRARNNLGLAGGALATVSSTLSDLAGMGDSGVVAGEIEAGTYRNTFGCVRDSVAIVPRASAVRADSSALGPQTALVVGLADAVATTGRDHQVRIQFAWQRGAAANAGGLAHNTDAKGNAPGNEASGTWVRVAEALAGPNWGSQFTPRIGTEVLVDFIEGDMDRPLVVAQLYTGSDTPPYCAGVDSGVNHAGVISGIHSNNFDANGYNQWVVDDTPGQLRTRLASSGAATQLNLGYLVQQGANTAQRGAYRGSGFELRSDAWGMLRGGEGVLISTTKRSHSGAGVNSTQLDTREALGRLRGASELNKVLAGAAKQQSALFSQDANQAQLDLVRQLDPQQDGRHPASVGGHSAFKAAQGERTLDTAQPVEKFAQPLVLMDAPASINWATPGSTVLFAGQQLQWTTQSDLQMTAGHTMSSVAANANALFTHAGGIQAIAANGAVSLQAHTGQLEILADKAITVISVNDIIDIKANQKITLQAGQASITLEGGNITFACPGNFTVKGGEHVFDGGASAAAALVKLPDTRIKLFDEGFLLTDRDSGEAMPRQPYRIKRADGSYEEGMTDEQGLTHVAAAAAPEDLEIELLQARGSPKLQTAPTQAPSSASSPDTPQFRQAGRSAMTPVAVKQRKEVKVKLPACWIDDYEKEISCHQYGRYSTSYSNDGTERIAENSAWFKLYVPVKSNSAVVVELRIKAEAVVDAISEIFDQQNQGTPAAELRKAQRENQVAVAKRTAVSGIEGHWNNKFQLAIEDPHCGRKLLPIIYKIVWDDSTPHYIMKIHKQYDRDGVLDNFILVSVDTDEWTYAHEFGHCIGLPDEYSFLNVSGETTKYFKPDGTLDVTLETPFNGKSRDDPEATIMSSADVTTVKIRHAWNIAIEAQELLRKKIGRKITCEII